MGGRPGSGRPLATRLIVFFTVEQCLSKDPVRLSAEEIAHMFNFTRKHVSTTLRYSVKHGWIARAPRNDPKRITRSVIEYTAGPTLLEEIG